MSIPSPIDAPFSANVAALSDVLQVAAATAEEAATRVNLTSHARYFPQITGPGVDLRGMKRVYAWLDERDKK